MSRSLRGILYSLALAFALGSGAACAGSVWTSAVTKWDGDCPGAERDWWDDMCMAWRQEMGVLGNAQVWRNFQFVSVGRYADPSINSWANDNGNIDSTDAGLICLHGHDDNVGWVGSMHTKDHGECGLNVNQMKLGKASGGHSRFYQMSSCQSMQWDKRSSWDSVATGGVHAIMGFHGLMWIGSPYVDEYSDLAWDGMFGQGVAKAWVDDMYHVDHWYNAYKSTCPVARAYGEDSAHAHDALSEQYGVNHADTPANFVVTRFISECSPSEGGGSLPH
ncbi:MAG: hypothetical protein ACHQIO_01975 [Nevskiales bacterium]